MNFETAERIRSEATHPACTLRMLSDKHGVSVSTIQRIVKGKAYIQPDPLPLNLDTHRLLRNHMREHESLNDTAIRAIRGHLLPPRLRQGD